VYITKNAQNEFFMKKCIHTHQINTERKERMSSFLAKVMFDFKGQGEFFLAILDDKPLPVIIAWIVLLFLLYEEVGRFLRRIYQRKTAKCFKSAGLIVVYQIFEFALRTACKERFTAEK
jgi:hypothetical protein